MRNGREIIKTIKSAGRGKIITGLIVEKKSEPNRIKCRHCLRLTEKSCPYPGAKSIHAKSLENRNCKQAVMNRYYEKMYRNGKVS